jgi:hypothetical protein
VCCRVARNGDRLRLAGDRLQAEPIEVPGLGAPACPLRQTKGLRGDGFYLPREVFFGRLGVACDFFSVWASDFGRFFPAMSSSFPTVLFGGHGSDLASPYAVSLPSTQVSRR